MEQHIERIDGLAIFLQAPALKLIEQCRVKLNVTLLVVQRWRSLQNQMLIYQKGRT